MDKNKIARINELAKKAKTPEGLTEEELKEKKNEILNKNNIPLDYDEVKYKCEKCL